MIIIKKTYLKTEPNFSIILFWEIIGTKNVNYNTESHQNNKQGYAHPQANSFPWLFF